MAKATPTSPVNANRVASQNGASKSSATVKLRASDIQGAFLAKLPTHAPDFTLIWKSYLTTALVAFPVAVYTLFSLYVAVRYLLFVIFGMPLFAGASYGLYPLVYLLGVVLGGAFVAFLARPFFPAKTEKAEIVVEQGKEAALFLWVNSIAEQLNAPKITRIVFNTDVVVQAYYQRFAHWKTKELTLELGMPVLHGLTVDEMASLIAHELAYYDDEKLGNCVAFKRMIRREMFKTFHHEDGWLAKVQHWQDKTALLAPVTAPLELGFNALATVCQFVYDVTADLTQDHDSKMCKRADAVQAALIGTQAFPTMLHHLIRTDQAFHTAMEKIHAREVFPDDLGRFVKNLMDEHSTEQTLDIELAAGEHYSNWHQQPAPSERVDASQNQTLPVAYHLPLALEDIFTRLASYSKALTKSFYLVNGVELERSKILKLDAGEKGQVSVQQSPVRKLLNDYTNGLFSDDVVWQAADVKKYAQVPPEKLVAVLNKIIANIRHTLPEYGEYRAQIAKQVQRHEQLHFGNWMLKNGSRQRPSQEQLARLKLDMDDFTAQYQASIDTYRKLFGNRIAAAIALDKGHKNFAVGVKLVAMQRMLAKLDSTLLDMRIKGSTIEKLIERRQHGEAKIHQQTIARLARMQLKNIQEVEAVFVSLPKSLLGARSAESLERVLEVTDVNGEAFEQGVLARSKALDSIYQQFNLAVSAQLVKIASQNEKRFKVRPVSVLRGDSSRSHAA